MLATMLAHTVRSTRHHCHPMSPTMSRQNSNSSISRRTFVKSLGVGAAISCCPLILRADDKAGGKAPVLGSGEHTYEAIHGWAQLPEGMKFGNTHMVQE